MYNGYKSYNAWNISLWINNNESLYRLAQDCVKFSSSRDEAAEKLLGYLSEKTPDSVPYTKTNLKLALRGF